MYEGLKCPEDGRPMLKRDGRWGPFLVCERWPICDVTHSLHPDGTPMGVPAKRSVREARVAAHNAFDGFWRARGWARGDAYGWLARTMGLPEKEAHIANLNFNQCYALMAIIRDTPDEVINEYEVDDTPEERVPIEVPPRNWAKNPRHSASALEARFKKYKGNRIRSLKRDHWNKDYE